MFEETIKKYGWAACGTTTKHGRPLTYSVGFNIKYNAPEVLIVGLHTRTAHDLIVCAAELLIKGEKPFGAGDTSGEIIEGAGGRECKVKFAECSDFIKTKFMCQAGFHYGGDFSALQMLYPDVEGRFPDEIEYDCISQLLCEKDL